MGAQRGLRGGEIFEIEAIEFPARGAGSGRFPLGGKVRSQALRRSDIVGKHVLERRIELLGHRLGTVPAVALEPVVGRIVAVVAGLENLVGCGVVLRLDALEERIALDLFVDETLEFEMRELQQLDRLHQLRGHDQRLRLPKLKFGAQ